MISNLIKLLFALCMLFVVILLLEWLFLDSSENQFSDTLLTTDATQNQPIELPEIMLSKQAKETYTMIVEKPLFIQGRRPVEEDVEVNDKKVGGKVDDLILDGIYTVDGRMVALMRESKTGKDYLKKSEGDELVGWTIKEIRADSVVLGSAGKEKSIMLRKPREKPRSKPGAKRRAKPKIANKRQEKVPPKKMKQNPEK